ncbi:MAG: hypothetical protein RBT34_08520 [Anaerolineaceae bacterium]|jgi:hypothetical protein|nr:hypothetical protein [Anaerolineaceae bacterium]
MTEKYIPIYSANGINNAILIKNLLVSFNIPAETYQESAGITYGIVSGPLGQALVYVPASHLEDANAIIRAYENNEFAAPDENIESSEDSD